MSRIRRIGVVVIAVGAITLISGCQVARPGARCAPNGKWGRTDSHVLVCSKGRWKNTGMTLQEAARILYPPAPTPAPTPAPQPQWPVPVTPAPTYVNHDVHHLTTYEGTVPYGADLPDPEDIGRQGGQLTWTSGNPICQISSVGGGANISWDWEPVDADHLSFIVQIDWISGEGEWMAGRYGCLTDPTLHFDVLDADGAVILGDQSIPLVSDPTDVVR